MLYLLLYFKRGLSSGYIILVAIFAAYFEYNRSMKYTILLMCTVILAAGCAGVTSPTAEKVTLYEDENALPAGCTQLGEVTASVCANTTPCPAEVMKKDLRERAYIDYGADAVLLSNTTLSGTEVVGYGIAYSCK